ncbi:MAG: MASE1 domain-containing protein [Candidatus Omnitrophica bacterium]|nr:MASE1 domain-containing protein [Candidatus Omnitrophota bacterium]
MKKLLEIGIMAVAYLTTALFGFLFAIPPGNVTILWPPSGLALAGTLLRGPRIWPGIWMGSFLANLIFFIHMPTAGMAGLLVSCAIATGSTLQALAGAFLIRNWVGTQNPFNRSRDMVMFLGIGIVACLIASTCGVAGLWLGRFVGSAAFAQTWLTWWLGDLIGVCIVTPLIITWGQFSRLDWTPRRWGEAIAFVCAWVAVSEFIFGSHSAFAVNKYPLAWAVLPFIIWAGVRFGSSGVMLSIMAMAYLAVKGAGTGLGPFSTQSPPESFLFTQIFMGFITVSGLLVAAIFFERQEAEEQFRLTVEGAPYAMLVVDGEGRIVLANAQAESTFGYARSELVGRPVELLIPSRVQGAHERHRKEFFHAPTARPMGQGRDLYARHKDGTEIPVEIGLNPIRTSEGAFILAAIIDISERKRGEKAVRWAYEELERRVEQRTAELKEKHARLIQAEKLESIGRLAASIVHEVKTPLTLLRLGVERITKDLDRMTEDDLKGVLDDMVYAVEGADRIIKGLLKYSAPVRIEPEPTDLNALVEEAFLQVTHKLRGSCINPIMGLTPGLPPLMLDRQKIMQVLVNLISNAIDAMPVSGILRIETRVDRIRDLDSFPGGGKTRPFVLGDSVVSVSVEDTGPGISEADLPKIFDPFFTTKPIEQGTGLGLAISKTFVELHGGVIQVQNREEGGVRVTLTFKTELKLAASPHR